MLCSTFVSCILLFKIVYVLYLSMIAGKLKVSMKQLNICSSFQCKDTSAINCLLGDYQPS